MYTTPAGNCDSDRNPSLHRATLPLSATTQAFKRLDRTTDRLMGFGSQDAENGAFAPAEPKGSGLWDPNAEIEPAVSSPVTGMGDMRFAPNGATAAYSGPMAGTAPPGA